MTSIDELEEALQRLHLGRHVVVHASLRRLGPVLGGAEAVLDLLARTFETVMMPAFDFQSNAPPPPGDRPVRNGTDYSFYEGWSAPLVPFCLDRAGVDPKMGVLGQRFAARPGVARSAHPWHSWAAAGPLAGDLVASHEWEKPHLPLERLMRRSAHVLLLGVGLASCTALHVSEERAGRRPFVRWATDADGRVRRMRVAGCAKGFDALAPLVEGVLTRVSLGGCVLTAAPLDALVARGAAAMQAEPGRTVCSAGCVRCRDAVAGGPEG